MKYENIKFYNKAVQYNGFTQPFSITNQDVRKFISKLDYWYPRHPEYAVLDRDYENADIPNQAYSFYLFIVLKKKIPTLSEFCEYYFNQYCIKLDDTYFMFKPKHWTGVLEHGLGVARENRFPITACVGRLARAYTTFLREIELFTRLQDAGHKVQYSFEDDKYGTDLKIFGHTYTYCVKEFVATRKSLSKLQEKEANKADRFGQKTVYLPLYMSDTYAPMNIEVINNIYLYDGNASKYLMNLADGKTPVVNNAKLSTGM